ncbi:MAG: hypothetical protein M3Y53_03300, partial [Thermoproteota archaeon]|nr:hypothetical protein [Thermoproteota archaeon]
MKRFILTGISLFLIALITFEYSANWEIFAESSSFSRQEINTSSHNGIQVNAITRMQTKVDYKGPLDNTSSIQRVTYFSDGKTLNATLWLGGAINKNPSRDGASTVVYGMLIDSDNNPATGKYGADYLKEIQWTNKTKTWNVLTAEFSSPINNRTLTIVKNYTGVSDNQKYVLISLNLKDITSPASYKVLYYAIVIYNQSKMLLDYTPWID